MWSSGYDIWLSIRRPYMLLQFLAVLMPFFPMHRCILNVWCLWEIHVIGVHLRSLAGPCWRTCALLRFLATLSGTYACFCGTWLCTCPFTHAQVRVECLMSMRSTCNRCAFAVFGRRLLAHMRAFAVFCDTQRLKCCKKKMELLILCKMAAYVV